MNFFIKSIKQFKNVFTFLFNYKANKLNIKKEIEKRYNISVKNVRTIILLLKKKSKYRKIKKVFIQLKEDQCIEV
jgi:ribosomal protein L23